MSYVPEYPEYSRIKIFKKVLILTQKQKSLNIFYAFYHEIVISKSFKILLKQKF